LGVVIWFDVGGVISYGGCIDPEMINGYALEF